MDSIQEARLVMYMGVIDLTDEISSEIAAKPALAQGVTAFKTLVGTIEETGRQGFKNITGVTVSKAQQKLQVADVTNRVGAALHAWADNTGNDEVRVATNTTFPKLLRARGGALALICLNYYETAVKYKAELVPYGITDAQLAAFKAAIDSFTDAVPAPRNATIKQSTNRVVLRQLFKDANRLLRNQLDRLIPTLPSANKHLATEYKKARMIVNAGRTVTQLKVVTTTADGKQPLKGVVITIEEIGITALTNSKGTIALKPMKPGEFKVMLSKEGFKAQEFLVEVKRGQVAMLEAKLEAVDVIK